MATDITYRPISEQDSSILLDIYSSARAEELAVVDWTQQQKQEFLKMQFDMQHHYYMLHYKEDLFELIIKENQIVGRLYTGRWKSQIRIIDIAILPNYRHLGIGTKIIESLQDEARASNRLLSIHVEKNNPALDLYLKLGFQQVEDKDVYWFMEWQPTAESSPELSRV